MGVPGKQVGQQVNYPNNPPTGWRIMQIRIGGGSRKLVM